MRKNKVQNKNKNRTESTETIRKLRIKLNKLEKEIKSLRHDFYWHEDKDDYLFAMIESSLKSSDDLDIPV